MNKRVLTTKAPNGESANTAALIVRSLPTPQGCHQFAGGPYGLEMFVIGFWKSGMVRPTQPKAIKEAPIETTTGLSTGYGLRFTRSAEIYYPSTYLRVSS